ncbi:MAG: DegT/DnrJ/EryC1/StrS family aminotransferase [Clostridiales bacterium]|nr:DegT/DnrJ/EryC1/StrS family aminotransferase [Clostridiales bacterium]
MIPIIDLKAQYASIEREIDEAIKRVLRSGHFILGPEVEALEKEVANLCGCKYGIGVASGTDALILAIKAVGIGPGDEVITTPFTFVATASSIVHCGAKPVFVDIDPLTFNINPDLIEKAITKKTKAIIPVHLYGQPAEMDKIMEIARAHNLIVIEDAAQAIGAKYKGRPVGQFGIAGCLSFFPTKSLGGYGDGGMVVTNDAELAERVGMLRIHGSKPRYYYHIIGANSRLDALQAAIIRAKLPYLAGWTVQRQMLANQYDKALSNVHLIKIPFRAPSCSHIFHQYTIRVTGGKRDPLKSFLADRGVASAVYYPMPLHLQSCFRELDYKQGDFPESEKASHEVISLPMFPELSEKELYLISNAVADFMRSVQ